jgi:hypothetical protein
MRKIVQSGHPASELKGNHVRLVAHVGTYFGTYGAVQSYNKIHAKEHNSKKHARAYIAAGRMAGLPM